MSTTRTSGLELTAFGITVAAISFLVTSGSRRRRRQRTAAGTATTSRGHRAAATLAPAPTAVIAATPITKRTALTPYLPYIYGGALIVGIFLLMSAAIFTTIHFAQAAHHIG